MKGRNSCSGTFNVVLFLIILSQFLIIAVQDVSGASGGRRYYINTRTAGDLKELLHYSGKAIPVLSSHRGGPETNMPENCIRTFANTLKHTFSIIEIDPRYTKDSVLVLHHDPTLQRTTTGKGRITDFTVRELKKFRLKDTRGNDTRYRIPTLDKVMKWAGGKAILLMDKKDVPIEVRVKIIETHNAEAYCIVMAYTFQEAKTCYRLNKDIMMQVFIPSSDKIDEFDKTNVPWENVVAFVGHQKPNDPELTELIHDRGARCIMGTSRNIDRDYLESKVTGIGELKSRYCALLNEGIDILETDIPVPLSKIISECNSFDDQSLRKFFIFK